MFRSGVVKSTPLFSLVFFCFLLDWIRLRGSRRCLLVVFVLIVICRFLRNLAGYSRVDGYRPGVYIDRAFCSLWTGQVA